MSTENSQNIMATKDISNRSEKLKYDNNLESPDFESFEENDDEDASSLAVRKMKPRKVVNPEELSVDKIRKYKPETNRIESHISPEEEAEEYEVMFRPKIKQGSYDENTINHGTSTITPMDDAEDFEVLFRPKDRPIYSEKTKYSNTVTPSENVEDFEVHFRPKNKMTVTDDSNIHYSSSVAPRGSEEEYEVLFKPKMKDNYIPPISQPFRGKNVYTRALDDMEHMILGNTGNTTSHINGDRRGYDDIEEKYLNDKLRVKPKPQMLPTSTSSSSATVVSTTSLPNEATIQFMLEQRRAFDEEKLLLRQQNELLLSRLDSFLQQQQQQSSSSSSSTPNNQMNNMYHSQQQQQQQQLYDIHQDMLYPQQPYNNNNSSSGNNNNNNKKVTKLTAHDQYIHDISKDLATEAMLHPYNIKHNPNRIKPLQTSLSSSVAVAVASSSSSSSSRVAPYDYIENTTIRSNSNKGMINVSHSNDFYSNNQHLSLHGPNRHISPPYITTSSSKKQSFSYDDYDSPQKNHLYSQSNNSINNNLYMKIPSILWQGGYLWKVPYNGRSGPQRRVVALKRQLNKGSNSKRVCIINNEGDILNTTKAEYIYDPITIVWYTLKGDIIDMNERVRELVLHEGSHLVDGHNTPTFWKISRKGGVLPRKDLCFSIVTTSRTLDLAAESIHEAELWKQAFTTLFSLINTELSTHITKKHIAQPQMNHHPTSGPLSVYPTTVCMKNIPVNMRSHNIGENYREDSFGSTRASRTSADFNAQIGMNNNNNNNNNNSSNGSYKYNPITSTNNNNNNYMNNTSGNQYNNNSHNGSSNSSNNGSSKMRVDSSTYDEMKQQMFHATHTGQYALLENILTNGININLMEPGTRDTPLLIACRKGNGQIVALCLRFGAKNDPHPDFGTTALHTAVENNHYECVNILLRTAAETNSDTIITNLCDHTGKTPLHIATFIGYIQMIELLLRHGAEIDRLDSTGATPLHTAAFHGKQSSITTLVDQGADMIIDAQDNIGNTALHYAALNGHISCARLLLQTAANVSCENNMGQTAYLLAMSRGHHQISLLIQEYQSPYTISSYSEPVSMAQSPSRSNHHRVNAQSRSYDEIDNKNTYRNTESTLLQRRKNLNNNLQININAHGSGSGSVATRSRSQSQKFRDVDGDDFDVDDVDDTSQYRSNSPILHMNNRYNNRTMTITSSNEEIDEVNLMDDDDDDDMDPVDKPPPVFHPFTDYVTPIKPLVADEALPRPHQSGNKTGISRRNSLNDSHSSLGGIGDTSPLKVLSLERRHSFSVDTASYQEKQQNLIQVTSARIISTTSTPTHQSAQQQKKFNNLVIDALEADQFYDTHTYHQHGTINTTSNTDNGYSTTSANTATDTSTPPPLEEFYIDNNFWVVYMTGEGYTYYWCQGLDHSQWEDPRTFGLIPQADTQGNTDIHTMKSHDNMSTSTCSTPKLPNSPYTTRKNSFFGSSNNNSPTQESSQNSTSGGLMKLFPSIDTDMVIQSLNAHSNKDGKNNTMDNTSNISDSPLDVVSPLVNSPELDTRYHVHIPKLAGLGIAYNETLRSDHSDKSDTNYYSSRDILHHSGTSGTSGGGGIMALNSVTSNNSTNSTERFTPRIPSSPRTTSASTSNKGTVTLSPETRNLLQENRSKLTSSSSNPNLAGSSCSGLTIEKFSPKSSPLIAATKSISPLQGNTDNKMPTTMSPLNIPKFSDSPRQMSKLQKENNIHEESDDNKMPLTPSQDGTNTPKEIQKCTMTKEEAKIHPVFSKYMKMFDMHIPATGVIQKMNMDQIDSILIQQFSEIIGYESNDFKSPLSKGTNAMGLGQTPEMARKPSISLMKMHWSTIPADKLRNSLWASYDNDMNNNKNNDDLYFQETDIDELEQLFGAATKTLPMKTNTTTTGGGMNNRTNNVRNGAVSSSGGGNNSGSSSSNSGSQENDNDMVQAPSDPSKLHIIDGKRSQNVIIGLVPFKSVGSTQDIIKAILSLNTLNGILNADRLCNFAILLPTEYEIKNLPSCHKTTNIAELFLKEMVTYMPVIHRRLETFIICEQFDCHVKEMHDKADILLRTATKILSSESLTRILRKMLAVGNIMNQGTRNGRAVGFTLDSMLKMVHTKGVDKKTTVLDYVIKSIIEKDGDAILINTLIEELDGSESAGRVGNNKELSEEMHAIVRNYGDLEKEYSRIQQSIQSHSTHSDTSATILTSRSGYLGNIDLQYEHNLKVYIQSFATPVQQIQKDEKELNIKLKELIEYFGEDFNTCDISKVFTTMAEFRRVIIVSRDMILRKIKAATMGRK